jgi:hypothetical protein
MDFLNSEEQTRIKIKKLVDQPKPAPAPAPGVKGPVPPGAGLRPGLPVRPGVPGARPGVIPAKPGAPTPVAVAVAAVVKPKQPPKVQVNQVEPGIFEVHFTCSCGEQYVIRCDSANPPPVPGASDAVSGAENSSAPRPPQ